MIKILNCGIDTFLQNTKDKKLYLFGAGRRAEHLCNTLLLSDMLHGVIDNKFGGTTIQLNGKEVPVYRVEEFVETIKNDSIEKIKIIITSAFYAWDIIQQLDVVKELDGIECYDMNLLLDYYERKEFDFTKGAFQIPKKIHYCWVGGKEVPQRLQRCIDTWKEFCPDYEIIRWDESNYDFTKNRYMNEAYQSKNWGFVPDYARLDIIYREGGIYLDTDVELVANMDKLLCDEAFFGADSNLIINLGQGFGAKKGNPFVKELRDYYDQKQFIKIDGTFNMAPCYMYQHPIFIKYGFEIKNEYQEKNGIVVYPSEVSAPTGRCGIWRNFTEKTISIHHNDFSWIEKEEFNHLEEYKKKILTRVGGN